MLSVVVIGRNEGARLARCLASVAAIGGQAGSIEVLYVDSASTDDSVEVARTFGVKVIALTAERSCAARGRNAGWKAASASIVLFLDGDTELASDFVARSIEEFQNPRVAVVFGHRRERNPGESIFNRVLDLDWISPAGLADFCGGDALMRRSVLEEVGGFDESLIAGEEPDLCRRLRLRGYLVLHVDRLMTLHDLAMTRLSEYWLRAKRTGYAYAEVSARFGASRSPLWRRESNRNLRNGAILVGLVLGSLACSLALHSATPLSIALVGVVALATRTAIRNRWKSSSPATLLMYGLHSQLAQIPILFGQLTYRFRRRQGTIQRLIEYRERSTPDVSTKPPEKKPGLSTVG